MSEEEHWVFITKKEVGCGKSCLRRYMNEEIA